MQHDPTDVAISIIDLERQLVTEEAFDEPATPAGDEPIDIYEIGAFKLTGWTDGAWTFVREPSCA